MLTQQSRERYIHYRVHIYNPNTNYIRLVNCKYCKQDKRDYYGSIFRTPNSMARNRNTNINLLNYRRVQNVIRSNIRSNNFSNNRISANSTSNTTNILNNIPNTVVNRYVPSNYQSNNISINHRIRPNNSIRQNNNNSQNNNIRQNNSIGQNSNTVNTIPNVNFIQRNINNVRRRRIRNTYSILPNRPLTNNYLTNLENDVSSLDSLSDNEIEDFEEFVDMEVKTTLEEVNKGSEIEIYDKLEKDYCVICCEDIKYSDLIRKMKCQHIFHYKCLDEWLETNKKCPVCRFTL